MNQSNGEPHAQHPENFRPRAGTVRAVQLADRQGNTPLQLARSRSYREMVQMLEQARGGASP